MFIVLWLFLKSSQILRLHHIFSYCCKVFSAFSNTSTYRFPSVPRGTPLVSTAVAKNKQITHQFKYLLSIYNQEFQSLAIRGILRCLTYIPSFSNVEALGLLRLLTNVSSLNDDGIVPLQFQFAITSLHHAYVCNTNNKNTTLRLLLLSKTACLQCFDAVGWVAGRASGL